MAYFRAADADFIHAEAASTPAEIIFTPAKRDSPHTFVYVAAVGINFLVADGNFTPADGSFTSADGNFTRADENFSLLLFMARPLV